MGLMREEGREAVSGLEGAYGPLEGRRAEDEMRLLLEGSENPPLLRMAASSLEGGENPPLPGE